MTGISVRGIDEKAVLLLKKQAHQEGSSLNALIVRQLESVAGVRQKANNAKGAEHFDDLDALQGTWSEQDAREFEAATADFSEEHGAGLLTREAHFSEIDGLRCGRQPADFLP